jgi:hypothetical protein
MYDSNQRSHAALTLPAMFGDTVSPALRARASSQAFAKSAPSDTHRSPPPRKSRMYQPGRPFLRNIPFGSFGISSPFP